MDAFETYRAGVDDVLRTVVKRQAQQLDQLRTAVELRHGDWTGILKNAVLPDLGKRLIQQLAEADKDKQVTPEQVAQLEALIYERLPALP